MAKVYVSSTYTDLEEHRKKVSLLLRRMGHEDMAMEYYVAQDERPANKCLADIASCDLYVGIFAWRYGYIPKEDNPQGYSITELEYREAIKTNKPCLIFLLSEVAPWPRKFVDKDASSIEKLREELSNNHSTGPHFSTPDELGRLLAEAMVKWMQLDNNEIKIFHNLPQPNYGKFIPRLKDMTNVMLGLKSRYPLITIEGFAGVGKTSLALETAYICLGKVESPIPDPPIYDYVVWISAVNKPEQKQWLNEVVNEVLNTISVNSAPSHLPRNEIQEMKKVYELLQINKTLIVIDNFETMDDLSLVNWIEKVPAPSKVLLTSRIHQLQKAWDVTLKGLENKEALSFIRQEAQAKAIDWIKDQTDDELLSLADVTGGNPQAMVLALGLMKGGTLNLKQIRNHIHESTRSKSMEKVFESLYSWSWNQLKEDARKILMSIPLFETENTANQRAADRITGISKVPLYKVSGLQEYEFDLALEMLVKYNLIEFEGEEDRYSVHPMTREFASKQLDKNIEFNTGARERWSDYFMGFVQKHIPRKEPSVRYWNALVSDDMIEIDAEWSNIAEVIKWTINNRKDVFYELVMLLIHYMDSRLLNQARIDCVEKAVAIAQEKEYYEDEALLRLDALGWTYVEEGDLDKAYEEIVRGLAIADRLPEDNKNKHDLIALGKAWQARVKVEKNYPMEAQELIKEALDLSFSPWIETRVFMVAGDLAFKKDDSKKALEYYELAAARIKDYGEEGHGYQIEPRIGLAYLGIEGKLEEAKNRFEMLRRQDKIAIGKLYGEYGLALVAYKKGDKKKSSEMMKSIKEELSPKTKSNLLVKLIDKFFEDLKAKDK